ncbi:MAG TPA: SCO family protein [Thermoanaerobaculia bacterium]|jgi:protein SCO1/2|nr:SCO family protein [Thermoanaerobaculia bacterium]
MKRFLLALLLIAPLIASAADAPAAHYFADLKLTDQNGRRVDLYQDLMKGKTVVINSFFASCTASCVVMSRTFIYMQEKFGDRVGSDVTLVSISVDPEHDTPEKLKAYAKRVGARPGWFLLTGTREQVDAALRKLGQYTEGREGHLNVIVAGNDRTGLWKKALGIAKSEEVYKVVASVADDKGETPAGGR